MRFIAVLLSASLLAVGCDDTADLLAEGRVADACFHAGAAPAEHALVEQWFVTHAPVRVDVVPQQTLAAALGAPVHIGASGPVAWDVDGTIAAVPEARVRLAVQTEAPLATLVEHLPPLVVADRAPVPAVVDSATLAPTPRPVAPRPSRDFWKDPVGSFIEGTLDVTVAVATGVGELIGLAVAAPLVAVGSVIGGFFDAIGSIFSGGGAAPAVPTERLPLHRLDVVDGAAVDALLDAREQQDALIALSAEHAEQDLLAQTERARRLALLDDPSVLTPGDCDTGRCRLLLETPPTTIAATVQLERERFFGGTDVCEIRWDATVVVTGSRADVVIAEAPTVPAAVLASTRLTTPLAPSTPAWAAQRSVALPNDKTTKPATPGHVDRIADLACSVTVKQRRFDVDGSAPDLIVRATVGFARSRATSLVLGRNVTSTRFVVHGADVVIGERVRLSFTSDNDRSLGGAIVTFDGTAPLVLENAAFRAVCAPDAGASDAVVTRALDKAAAAVKVFVDDDNTMASPRPDFTTRHKREQAAEAAVVAVAALVGFDDPRVAAFVAAVDGARQ